jgi:hypothetical protein
MSTVDSMPWSVHPAERTGVNLAQGSDLLVGGLGRHHEDGAPVAVVDGTGPVQDRHRGHAGEVDVAAAALTDDVGHEGLAAAVLRGGEAAEVAVPTGLSVAALVAHPPERDHRVATAVSVSVSTVM